MCECVCSGHTAVYLYIYICTTAFNVVVAVAIAFFFFNPIICIRVFPFSRCTLYAVLCTGTLYFYAKVTLITSFELKTKFALLKIMSSLRVYVFV